MKLLISLVLLICCRFSLAAVSNDTLSAADKARLATSLRNSTFGYLYLADSFSRNDDSVNASAWLLKTNPYHVTWWFDHVPVDSIIAKFLLTPTASNRFRDSYIKSLSDSSRLFSTFKKMREDDQFARSMMEKCGDSFTCAKLSARLKKTDSIHFDFLYRYVNESGWPTLENGSLYASLIAIHDHGHHDFYLPHLKKAVEQGQLPMDPLNLVLYWRSRPSGMALKKMLDTSRKLTFDVSSILANKLPASLPRIINSAKKHCVVKLHLVFEAQDIKLYEQWTARTNYPGSHDHSIQRLFDAIFEVCPIKMHKGRSVYEGTSQISWVPAEHKRPKIMLYLVYAEP
jgi:hypothetical protein